MTWKPASVKTDCNLPPSVPATMLLFESFSDHRFVGSTIYKHPRVSKTLCASVTYSLQFDPHMAKHRIRISDTEQIGQIIGMVKEQLVASNEYTVEKHKLMATEELAARDYSEKVISEWIDFIE